MSSFETRVKQIVAIAKELQSFEMTENELKRIGEDQRVDKKLNVIAH